jgi:cytochrome c biogenesis protein ResB
MRIVDTLSSTKLFFAIAALILAAFLAGGVFPQGLSMLEYREMLGRVGAEWITKLRFNDVFLSSWFLALMAGAAINLLACTIKQRRLIRLRPGVFLTHLAVILLFIGGTVRRVSREGGVLALGTGETRDVFTNAGGKTKTLPFEVRLNDFRITYWEGEKHFLHAFRGEAEIVESVEAREGLDAVFKTVPVNVRVLKFYPNFSVGPSGPLSAGDSRANPALTIVSRNKTTAAPRLLFARYPEPPGAPGSSGIRLVYEYLPGRIKQFESRITISEGGALKAEKTISVNSPAYYRGYRLYQSGYDPENLKFSIIQVSRDPSVNIIYAGFALLMLGLTLAFWKEIKK